MNHWTRYLSGAAKDQDSQQPLVTDQHQADSSSGPSAPPYGAQHMPDFPDPVKPGRQQHHQGEPACYQQATSDAYQAGQAYPVPPYTHQQQPYLAEGYPVLQHATQPPVHHAPPLVVNSELVVLEPLRGSHVVLACPHCGHTGPAAVRKEAGFVTFFSSFLLCFLGCCVLSLFPFCSDCTKDWVYRCSRCGNLFGKERP